MFRLLETDIREREKYDKGIRQSADNTVNDLPFKVKFGNCVKDENNIFIKRNIAFLF